MAELAMWPASRNGISEGGRAEKYTSCWQDDEGCQTTGKIYQRIRDQQKKTVDLFIVQKMQTGVCQPQLNMFGASIFDPQQSEREMGASGKVPLGGWIPKGYCYRFEHANLVRVWIMFMVDLVECLYSGCDPKHPKEGRIPNWSSPYDGRVRFLLVEYFRFHRATVYGFHDERMGRVSFIKIEYNDLDVVQHQ